jgi:beta-glucosidase/6-phospho-beta-glucosidase/beta-galactosidase
LQQAWDAAFASQKLLPHPILMPDCNSAIALHAACRYEEDAALASSLGCNGFRLSLEWSRIEPRRGYIDQDAVQR